jgi:hypothetical protein
VNMVIRVQVLSTVSRRSLEEGGLNSVSNSLTECVSD